jgi:nitrite reductase/ring-hydroxylating ferredoxin subunit
MKTTTRWHKIFESVEEAIQQIPLNTLYSLRIDIRKICITHTSRGFSAMEDACPHKLIPLSKGYVNEHNEVVCVWHKYCFDTATGYEMTDKNIRPVKVYPLEVREDGLFIALPTRPQKTDDFSY